MFVSLNLHLVLQICRIYNISLMEIILNLNYFLSAGAGRTGVLMAIDTQLQRASVKGDIDIYNYALAMRNARPWMVQMPVSSKKHLQIFVQAVPRSGP